MRAFVALEIPDSGVLDAVAAFQKEIMATGADLRLVERENLHFTVKFLGEIRENEAREADTLLKGLNLKAAEVEVKGTGAFPSLGRPSVLWVSLDEEGQEKVAEIALPAIRALENIGEKDSRPFRAHLTIARVRSDRNVRELAALVAANASRPFGRGRLRSLKLKSSVLTPRGPVYTDLGRYPLT